MSRCYFQLKVGAFWLAPNPSVSVIEPEDFIQVTPNTEGCANCGGDSLISKREIVYKIRYKGRGSLQTAWSMYNRLDVVLSSGCALNKQIGFERRVCDEAWLKYNIRSAWQRVIEPWSQLSCDRILTAELHLNLVTYNADNLVDYGGGPFSSSFG